MFKKTDCELQENNYIWSESQVVSWGNGGFLLYKLLLSLQPNSEAFIGGQ